MMNSFALKSCLFVQQCIQSTRKKALSAMLRRPVSSRRIAVGGEARGAVDGVGMQGRRNTSVYVLSSVMFVMISLSIILNILEGAMGLLPPLAATAAIALLAILWTRFVGTHATAVLFILNFSLMCVGMFLFLRQGGPDGSSLFWFIVFPPMVMVTTGLRNGSIVFACFYLAILLLLFTPLDSFLVHQYSRSIRIRFMLAMFGAFFFSWWVEYLRFRTHNMLMAAMDTLERDSLTDHLTGLANRRDFYNTLSRVMAGSRRKKEPYVLALMDLDHFKNVNDRYGHQVGDQVLRHAAETIAGQIRETDRMFRWGGEEFAVLMPDCTAEQALAVAERIRHRVEENAFAGAEHESVSLTISIGLYCGDESRDQDAPIRVADANLYAAKAAGRNRVVCDARDPRRRDRATSLY